MVNGVPLMGPDFLPYVPFGAVYRFGDGTAPYWEWMVTIPRRQRTGMKLEDLAGSVRISELNFTINEVVKGLYHGGYLKQGDFITLVNGEAIASYRAAKKLLDKQAERWERGGGGGVTHMVAF